MNILLIVGIACLLLGFLIGQLIRTTKVRQKNQELEKQEHQAQLRIKDLENEYTKRMADLVRKYDESNKQLDENYQNTLNQITEAKASWEQEKTKRIISWTQHESDLKSEVSGLEKQIEDKKRFIDDLDEQAKISIKLIEEQVLDNVSNNVEQKSKELYTKYEKLESELQLHYVDLADDQWDNFIIKNEELNNKILEKENLLEELRSKAAAATEINKHMELDKQKKDFYRLQLSDIDLEEIKKIRSIEPYLRKKEPLNKVIWKVYYEKPYTDLIGRIIGNGRHTGIYKITNIENGMCYIGQALDIAERWKQHIKRGIGADSPTQNKLYPVMQSLGVENFTFEVVEECDSKVLNEREDYWQDFYHAKDFGYSIK